MPVNTLSFIYKSLVLPLIDYCDIVYGFTYKTHTNKLKIKQNITARIITFSNSRESFDNLSSILKWDNLENRFNFHAVKYIFKATHNLASNNSSEFFNFISRVNKRLGEDSKMLTVPIAKHNFLSNSIFYTGVKLWNSLPFIIRDSQNLNVFIKKTKEFYNIF